MARLFFSDPNLSLCTQLRSRPKLPRQWYDEIAAINGERQRTSPGIRIKGASTFGLS